jgi:hypothetical protein
MIDLDIVSNQLEIQNDKIDKFTSVLESVQISILKQTDILQETLKIEKDRLKSNQRQEKLQSVDQTKINKVKENKTDSSVITENNSLGLGLSSLIGGALGAISIAGFARLLAKTPLLAFIAPVAGEWVGNLIKEGLDNFNLSGIESGFNESISNGLGTAVEWGLIGRIFGKKVGLIFGAAGFASSFGDKLFEKLDSNKNGIIEAFGLELTNTNLSAIMGALGGAIVLALPSLIRKGLLPALSRAIGMGAAGAAGGAAAAAGSRSAAAPTIKPRNFTYNPIDNSYTSNISGKKLTGNAAKTAEATRLADEKLLAEAAKRYPGFAKLLKGGSIIGGLISLPIIASILMNDDLTNDEKTEAVSGEIGSLLGGIGGAAIGASIAGALGASVTGPGGILTGVAGGVLGAFAGDWVGSQLGSIIVGNKKDFDDLPKPISDSLYSETNRNTNNKIKNLEMERNSIQDSILIAGFSTPEMEERLAQINSDIYSASNSNLLSAGLIGREDNIDKNLQALIRNNDFIEFSSSNPVINQENIKKVSSAPQATILNYVSNAPINYSPVISNVSPTNISTSNSNVAIMSDGQNPTSLPGGVN